MKPEQPPEAAPSGEIRFLLNARPVSIAGLDPTVSVLRLLRERLRKTGTKEGCAEGDCGACTVVVGERVEGHLRTSAVNACIRFAPTLHGKALFTVEGLRSPQGELHPVQRALVEAHGSQCGFCTPGFVMSLWQLYLEHQRTGERPSRDTIGAALTGNLCRCTGYRPILDAGEKMFDPPARPFDRTAILRALDALGCDGTIDYTHAGRRFVAPGTMGELLRLRTEKPQATLLAGCTDIGLWVNKQLRDLGDIIYLGEVAALKRVQDGGSAIRIGAGVNLNVAYRALSPHYPEIGEMWARFASDPVRNAGTLGGNLANGSPIGDSMPWLIAVGAKVVLRDRSRTRSIPLESLYVDYMRNSMQIDEIIEAIDVPLPAQGQRFRTYKLSKRFDSDISAVCAAFCLRLQDTRIVEARVAFGGMAAIPKRAEKCEAALLGKDWNDDTLGAATAALDQDFAPLSDMRASSGYRRSAARNLLRRFFLETRPNHPLPARQVSVFAL